MDDDEAEEELGEDSGLVESLEVAVLAAASVSDTATAEEL
jgi:hypothetical protein